MAPDDLVDLKKLAEEVSQSSYDPRAKRCWLWSHQWTMWKPNFPGSSFQRRRCVRCGKTKEKMVSFF